MVAKPSTIAKRRLLLWFHRRGIGASHDLFQLARRAWFALQVIDHPSNQHESIKALNTKAVTEFVDAAAAYERNSR